MIPWITPIIPAISFGLLFSSVTRSSAQFEFDIVTNPSNNSQELSQIGPARFLLQSTHLRLSSDIHLAPLTYPLASLTGPDFSVSAAPPSPFSVRGTVGLMEKVGWMGMMFDVGMILPEESR